MKRRSAIPHITIGWFIEQLENTYLIEQDFKVNKFQEVQYIWVLLLYGQLLNYLTLGKSFLNFSVNIIC